MISIEPLSGLCNRMRALDSAISLAKKLDRPLNLYWFRANDLNCRFDQIFEFPDIINNLTEGSFSSLITRFLRKLNLLYHDTYLDYSTVINLIKQDYNFERFKNIDKLYISTGFRFHSSDKPFQDFIPVEPLQRVIESYTKGFKNTIGVHIRRTDNGKASKYSPTEAFIEQMDEELKVNKDTRFFLATDSLDEEFKLRQVFKDRIITYEKRTLNRSDLHAIQDAVIDLFCLSRCKKLIGSYHSSFTLIAGKINEIEVHTIKKNAPEETFINNSW